MTALALPVVLAALALGTAWLVAWPLHRTAIRLLPLPGGERSERAGWTPSAAWFLLLLVLPVAIGVAVAGGAAWLGGLSGLLSWECPCGGVGWEYHLCIKHPATAWPLVPHALAVFVLLGGRPLRTAVAVLREAGQVRAYARAAARWAAGDARICLADLPVRNAFTVGLLRTAVVADRTWWSGLDAQGRAAVYAHERAHCRARDPLVQLLARLLAGLSPRRTADLLVAGWQDAAERTADRAAAAAVGDPLAVAEILVREHRSGALPDGAAAFAQGSVERRVRALLLLDDGVQSADRRPPALLVLGMLVALVTLALSGQTLHAAVESVLQLTHHLH